MIEILSVGLKKEDVQVQVMENGKVFSVTVPYSKFFDERIKF